MKIASLKPRIAQVKLGRDNPLVADRLRGYQATQRNRRYLAEHPLCETCRSAAATEVDHRLPLHLGGIDAEPNLQGLCHPCHAAKTAAEQRARAGLVGG